MPGLVAAKSLPQVRFVVSLPLSLVATMSLACAAPHFEGLDAWLSETRQRLDPAFLDEMALVLGFPGRFQRFTEEVYATLLAEDPVLSYEAFVARLRGLPEEAYVEMAHRAIAGGGRRSSLPVPSPLPLVPFVLGPKDPGLGPKDQGSLGQSPQSLGLRTKGTRGAAEGQPEQVRALLQNSTALSEHLRLADLTVDLDATLAFLKDLAQLKPRFIAVVERFWREVYQEEWTATLPMMRRSTAYHRRQRYRLDFSDLFTTVTERLLPKAHADLAPERVRFVPSCYIGPYFAFMRHAGGLAVFYNCRTLHIGGPPSEGPGLFPMLKALADETRLQIVEMLRGREMYAQQIVGRLGISQAAVSRHLRLMASAGVLRVRREGGAKFYTVNGDTMTYLAEALRELGE